MSDLTQASEDAYLVRAMSESGLNLNDESAVADQSVFPIVLAHTSCKKEQIKKKWADFICQVIGEPHYSFTVTLRPLKGPRSSDTKVKDAKKAMSWFLNVLNTKCFGHGYRRKNIELGFFATLEGLGDYEQLHWHGAIRLPRRLTTEKFFRAFEAARQKTKRFGRQFELVPYYGKDWFEYTIKTGADSVHPEFLRPGTA
jgi:hypothetical protein